MTIEQIMAEMQQASRGFAAGTACANRAQDALRSLGRSAALAGPCVLPFMARHYRKTIDEHEAKLAAERLEAHRRATSNESGSRDGE